MQALLAPDRCARRQCLTGVGVRFCQVVPTSWIRKIYSDPGCLSYIKGKFDFHQRVYSICEFKVNACGRYFFYFFAMHFKKRVKQLSAKNSVDSVRMSMITEMPVWLPALAEQQRIADCLSSRDAQIAVESAKFDAIKTHKKGLLQQLFPSPEQEV